MLLKLKYEYPVLFIGKSVRIVRDPNAGTLLVSIFLTAAVGKNDGGGSYLVSAKTQIGFSCVGLSSLRPRPKSSARPSASSYVIHLGKDKFK